MGYNWNREQKAVIDARGRNILVSASAGSGKTTVMLERVRKLIVCDRVKLSGIVLLAFNNSIAEELRTKLFHALEEELISGRLTKEQKDHVTEQLENFDEAPISTIDGFCNKLMREHFEALDIDPSAEIAEDSAAEIKLHKCAVEIVKKAKSSNNSALDIYGLINKVGGERRLVDVIISLYKFACVQPDKNEWLKNAAGYYGKSIDETGLVKRYTRIMKDRHLSQTEELETLLFEAGADRKNAELPFTAVELTRRIIAANNYGDVYYLSRTVLPKQSYTKAIFGEKANEIKSLTKALVKALSDAAAIFDKTYDEADSIHLSCKRDVESLSELTAELADRYAAVKKTEGFVDYSDMTGNAARLLSDDDTAAEIAERYDYIFVDEYQDQNYIAEYILSRISNNNLFMVGDIKQSIYRFRLAEPQIMLLKEKLYRDEDENGNKTTEERKSIHLNSNYRSDAQLLDRINEIFDVIMTESNGGIDYARRERFTVNDVSHSFGSDRFQVKLFYKGQDVEQSEEPVADDSLYNPLNDSIDIKKDISYAEGDYIADKIEELLNSSIFDKKLNAFRKVVLSDICILSRERIKDGNAIANTIDALESRGFGVDRSGVEKVIGITEIDSIIDVLKVVDNGADDIPLAASLLSFWGGMTSEEIYEIRKDSRNGYFYECVEKARRYNDKVDKFYNLIESLRALSISGDVYDLVAYLVYDCGFITQLIKDNLKTSNVGEFMNSLKNYKGSLSEYLSAPNTTVKAAMQNTTEEYYIKTATIHTAKGLEWPIVFLIDCAANFNNGNKNKEILAFKDYGVAICSYNDKEMIKRDSFIRKILSLIDRDEQVNEEMRLFYVALTRAMNHLFVTGIVSKSNADVKYTNPYEVNNYKQWICNAVVKGKLSSRYISVEEVLPKENAPALTKEIARDLTFAADKINEYTTAVYPYIQATTLGLKHTVTELTERETYEDDITTVLQYGVQEKVNKSTGTDYHTILENIDYGADSYESVKSELERMVNDKILDIAQLSCVDIDEIVRIMNSDIIKTARENRHSREQEFMLKVKARDYYDCDTDDEILIQGAIDLIISGKELIIVDFKKSRRSDNELKKRYGKQIELYTRAAEEALGRKVDKKYLYVIGSDRIIDM